MIKTMINKLVHVYGCKIVLFAMLLFVCAETLGQAGDSLSQDAIAVSARPSDDSITLRWAPLDFNVWKVGNERGYRVERYVVSRNGILLAAPEKAILRHRLRPMEESQWMPLVQENKYAAIAAQAFFGDRFEVDLRQSDAFTIVNKVRENEQRFAFALFSADMSPAVAKASGLWLTDNQVKIGEKYLYRIILNAPDSVRGSIFVAPDDPYELPKPLNLQADFKDKFVSLKWDKGETMYYTAHVLERSVDGKVFRSISDSPLITVAPTAVADTRYEYALDSLPDLITTYHYRVRGITPFGEVGPPSSPVRGKGRPMVEQVPFITSAQSPNNSFIDIHWDFPSHNNAAIKGFEVRRGVEPKGNYDALTKELLTPQTRSFIDTSAGQSNYYKVLALGLDGEWYSSHVYYAQLVDSIPPHRPTGLKAEVSDKGQVTLSWDANTDADIYGYRIYKAYHQSEEFAQVTSEPLRKNTFVDAVDLNTLNEYVYYSVMSIDRTQNHSGLSQSLQVLLPDKVRPQPPVLLAHKSDHSGISISWRRGASADIVKYKVYRNVHGETEWMESRTLLAADDSVYFFKDTTTAAGKKYFYTVIAIDEAGLESTPTPPVAARTPITALRPAIEWKKPKLNREENTLTLGWNYREESVHIFRIYRSTGDERIVTFQNISGKEVQFSDTMVPGKTYRYRIMAVFVNGQKSSLSEELTFTF